MAQSTAALINKATLKTICENLQITDSHLADKAGVKDSSKIAEWLNHSSETLPTFNQAKKLAKCLNIPLAGLYMNPTDIPMPKLPKVTNRRTFTDGIIGDESTINLALIDLIRSRDLLLDVKVELNEEIVPFGVIINHREIVKRWAQEIRKIFNLSLAEQFNITSPRKFYLYVREKVELQGVFIYCFTGVNITQLRGVAIYDEKMPIIGINNNDRPPAKTFTIIHELTHLIKRQSSLCNEFFSDFSNQNEEIFCNAVAGEVLVPQDALLVKLRSRQSDENITIGIVESLANNFCVSKEVITRRLLDLDQISRDVYDAYYDEFRLSYEQEKVEQKAERELAKTEGRSVGIPRDIVRETIDRTSNALCTTLYKGYNEELFSKLDVCHYLGIKSKHIDKFIGEVSNWNS